jgi:ankyrin repeat protein
MILDLVDRGLDVNSYDDEHGTISALSFGISAQNFATVRSLLKRGARVCCSPPRSRWSPLHLAMQGGKDISSLETAKALLSRGADVNSYEFICWDRAHKCSEPDTISRFGNWLMTHPSGSKPFS